MEKLKGYRTLIINGLTLALLIATALTGTVTDAGTLQVLGGIVLIGNIVLRFLTTGAVGNKDGGV